MTSHEIGRLLVSALVGLSLGASSTASGQAVPKQANPAPLRELFLELDTNGDRVVSPDEVPDRGHAAFQTLLKHGDRDRDGRLSAEEYRDLMQRAGQARAGLATPEQRQRRFAQIDANHDGKLDGKELPGGPARLRLLDRDGDGSVSRDEFVAMSPNPAGPRANPAAGPLLRRLQAMDKDGDHRISREEFTGVPARFDRLDTNHDGFLDQADRPDAGSGPGPGERPKVKARS
jgi:Ca2+-binding EF-hand superfamily protein